MIQIQLMLEIYLGSAFVKIPATRASLVSQLAWSTAQGDGLVEGSMAGSCSPEAGAGRMRAAGLGLVMERLLSGIAGKRNLKGPETP